MVISKENMPTGILCLHAACSAMLRARAVLPTLVHALSMIRLPLLRPDIRLSRSRYPVGIPVMVDALGFSR